MRKSYAIHSLYVAIRRILYTSFSASTSNSDVCFVLRWTFDGLQAAEASDAASKVRREAIEEMFTDPICPPKHHLLK